MKLIVGSVIKIENIDDVNKTDNKYTLEEQAIINLIKNNPTIKQQELANAIGKSLRTVKARMDEMQNKNLIKRENVKRQGKWKVL